MIKRYKLWQAGRLEGHAVIIEADSPHTAARIRQKQVEGSELNLETSTWLVSDEEKIWTVDVTPVVEIVGYTVETFSCQEKEPR